MVSRPDSAGHDATTRAARPADALLLAWRRLLSRAFGAVGTLVVRTLDALRRAVTRLWRGLGRLLPGPAATLTAAATAVRTPSTSLRALDGAGLRRVSGAGVAASVLGAGGIALVGVLRSTDARTVASSAILLLVWAVARYVLLRLTVPHSLDSRQTSALWGLGTLPFSLAWTSLLDGVALAAGSLLTYRALRGARIAPTRAAIVVVVAFGSQLAVTVASWVVRAGALLMTALGE